VPDSIPPPDENDPTLHMTEADKQYLEMMGGAANVRSVFNSYVQAGFNEDQALELVKHVMSIGVQSTLLREIEARKSKPRSLFEIFGIGPRSEPDANQKLRNDITNQQHLTKEEPPSDAAPQGE
jgi:hypothetical protein